MTRNVVTATKHRLPVEVRISDVNIGLSLSIINGVSSVLKDHESVVVVEDDILLSKCALSYFSMGLRLYKQCHSVMSISGYGFPSSIMQVSHSYPYDAYFFPRAISWGWATWWDRWNRIDWTMDTWRKLREDPWVKYSYSCIGPDLPAMMNAQLEGRIDSWAVRFVWNHFVQGCQSLIPVHSYTQNIGMDGSGSHCSCTNRYFNELDKAVALPRLPPIVFQDSSISKGASKIYRKPSLASRGLRWLARQTFAKR